jgi:hypothetical protein
MTVKKETKKGEDEEKLRKKIKDGGIYLKIQTQLHHQKKKKENCFLPNSPVRENESKTTTLDPSNPSSPINAP